jgi:hypothetical protein
MWCHVALVKTDVSEEYIVSIISVERISELGTMTAVTSKLHYNTLFLNMYAYYNFNLISTYKDQYLSKD